MCRRVPGKWGWPDHVPACHPWAGWAQRGGRWGRSSPPPPTGLRPETGGHGGDAGARDEALGLAWVLPLHPPSLGSLWGAPKLTPRQTKPAELKHPNPTQPQLWGQNTGARGRHWGAKGGSQLQGQRGGHDRATSFVKNVYLPKGIKSTNFPPSAPPTTLVISLPNPRAPRAKDAWRVLGHKVSRLQPGSVPAGPSRSRNSPARSGCGEAAPFPQGPAGSSATSLRPPQVTVEPGSESSSLGSPPSAPHAV